MSAAPPRPPSTPDRAVEAGRGALLIGFAKVFFMISGSLQRFVLAWLVPQADYGAFGVVNVAVSTVNNTVVQGTIQSVSKFTAEDDARADAVKRAALRLQIFLGTAIGLGFFLAAPLIAHAYNADYYVGWFRLVAAIPLLYAFYAVFVGVANGLRRFRLQASFDIGFSTAKTILLLAGAAAGAAMGAAVTGAFVGFIAAAAVILVVAAAVLRLPASPAPFPLRRLLVFMGGVVTYTLLVNLALNWDLQLLRGVAGKAMAAKQADALVGNYEALRTLALLPYQALLVVTFVIFPMVSRSTFADDREATRAYVTQTLRYALILGAAMAAALVARPQATLLLFKPEYAQGAPALPVLGLGLVALALLSVCGSILNAAGRPQVAVLLVASTLAVGAATTFSLVPGAAPGGPMLLAMAVATAAGNAVGLLAALVYLRRRFGAGPPPATALRVGIAAAAALGVGRLLPLPAAPRGVMRLGTVAVALVVAGGVFLAVLIALREFGPTDREKLRKILRRR